MKKRRNLQKKQDQSKTSIIKSPPSSNKKTSSQAYDDLVRDPKPVHSEDDFESIFTKEMGSQAIRREETYSIFLRDFVYYYSRRQDYKNKYKKIFFCVMCSALIALIYIFGKALFEGLINSTSALISSLVGLITSLVSIPVVIAQYLFNTSEDEKLVDLIAKMQEHDLYLHKVIKHLPCDQFDNSDKTDKE